MATCLLVGAAGGRRSLSPSDSGTGAPASKSTGFSLPWQISQTLGWVWDIWRKIEVGIVTSGPLSRVPRRESLQADGLVWEQAPSAARARVAQPCLLLGFKKLRSCVSSIQKGGLVL